MSMCGGEQLHDDRLIFSSVHPDIASSSQADPQHSFAAKLKNLQGTARHNLSPPFGRIARTIAEKYIFSGLFFLLVLFALYRQI